MAAAVRVDATVEAPVAGAWTWRSSDPLGTAVDVDTPTLCSCVAKGAPATFVWGSARVIAFCRN
jgi:hypothetical protein